MRHSYKNKDDVILLLTDMTGKVKPVTMEERARRVAAGEYVRSIIIEEYKISKEYRDIVHQYMDSYTAAMAGYVGKLSELLYKEKGDELVLVDIVRAGIPIGILVHRYLKQFYGVDVPHYGISLVKGLDPAAMDFIIKKHGKKGIQFIDGWVGKGTVTKEIAKSVAESYPGVDPELAVLSDCVGFAGYTGTQKDVYIPHSPLNASATGLVSITVKNEEYSGEDGFHAAMYLEDLEEFDESEQFVRKVAAKFTKQPCGIRQHMQEGKDTAAAVMGSINRDIALLNPGINEAARAVLRRELEMLLVSSMDDGELFPLIRLAESKGVEVQECDKILPYKAVSVAKDGYVR